MYKHLLICNIFFIGLIGGKTIPTKIVVADTSSQPMKNNSTTQTVLSEGGSSVAVTLPNDNVGINLARLAKELNVTKGKPVVARKGVDPQDDIKHQDDRFIVKNSTVATNTSLAVANTTNKVVILPSKMAVLNGSKDVQDIKNSSTIPHKPLILSADLLKLTDKINNVQIDTTNINTKVQAMKSGSHPGMIMPLVITILVVPMFAAVGYLALKRGQEAWKNRHYKRMDFLLDGMYND